MCGRVLMGAGDRLGGYEMGCVAFIDSLHCPAPTRGPTGLGLKGRGSGRVTPAVGSLFNICPLGPPPPLPCPHATPQALLTDEKTTPPLEAEAESPFPRPS